MTKNPILEELYAIRSQIQAEHGEHLSAYLRNEFERLKAQGHPVAQLKQRTIRKHDETTRCDSTRVHVGKHDGVGGESGG